MAVDPTAFVHPLAVVDGAEIGARSKVWQFASVIRGAVLGSDCTVASGATLDGPRFGDRCVVCHNVAMGPGFVIGDDVFIGPNVTFCNDAWPRVDKDGFEVERLRDGFVTIRVGDGASIGANAVLLPGVTIGKGAMIAAGEVVRRHVPEGHLCRGGKVRPINPSWRALRMKAAG